MSKKLKKLVKESTPPVDLSHDIEIEELETTKSRDDILYPLLRDNEPIEKILQEVFEELPPEVRDKIIEEQIEEVRLGGRETARKFFESLIESEEGRKAVERVIEKRKKSSKTAKDFFSFE